MWHQVDNMHNKIHTNHTYIHTYCAKSVYIWHSSNHNYSNCTDFKETLEEFRPCCRFYQLDRWIVHYPLKCHSKCYKSYLLEKTEYMVSQSNIYQCQIQDRLNISSKTIKWMNITIPEMEKFLGLIVIIGQVQKEWLKDLL